MVDGAERRKPRKLVDKDVGELVDERVEVRLRLVPTQVAQCWVVLLVVQERVVRLDVDTVDEAVDLERVDAGLEGADDERVEVAERHRRAREAEVEQVGVVLHGERADGEVVDGRRVVPVGHEEERVGGDGGLRVAKEGDAEDGVDAGREGSDKERARRQLDPLDRQGREGEDREAHALVVGGELGVDGRVEAADVETESVYELGRDNICLCTRVDQCRRLAAALERRLHEEGVRRDLGRRGRRRRAAPPLLPPRQPRLVPSCIRGRRDDRLGHADAAKSDRRQRVVRKRLAKRRARGRGKGQRGGIRRGRTEIPCCSLRDVEGRP